VAKPLTRYRYNRYSQFGEDGIIEEICRRLNLGKGWFVEFGAWDGKHLSNTYNLLSHYDWCGVHIEGNPAKYQDLLLTQKVFPGKLHALCAMVGFEGENRLDRLLAQTPIPREFDLLSIDIDSFDWQVWRALDEYQPKIVVIECNSELLPGIFQTHNPPQYVGASFSSLVELGKNKGYQLVAHTGNCIFVRNELVTALDLDSSVLAQPEKLFDHGKHFREKLLSRARKILPQRAMNFIYDTSYKRKDLFRKK
jgi:hypothetical protein